MPAKNMPKRKAASGRRSRNLDPVQNHQLMGTFGNSEKLYNPSSELDSAFWSYFLALQTSFVFHSAIGWNLILSAIC
jgi:hypothetical protein